MLTIVVIICIFSIKTRLNLAIDDNICSKYSLNYNLELLEIKKDYGLIEEYYDFIPAEVLNIGVRKISNLFLINKGSNENIQEGSFVVNADGLVGITVKVYQSFSVVRLITSKYTNLAVETNNCYGSLEYSKGELVINDLINCDSVNVDDNVYTSKYNYSSSNILIGTVRKISKNKLIVKPVINPYKLKYVGVINDNY